MPGEDLFYNQSAKTFYVQKWICPKMILPTKSSNHVEAQFNHWFNFQKNFPFGSIYGNICKVLETKDG